MSKCQFFFKQIKKMQRNFTQSFTPILPGPHFSTCTVYITHRVPTKALIIISIGGPRSLLPSQHCFASTNQPEGNSFKNKTVPSKFSTVPSKKQAFNKYPINECKPPPMLTCTNDLWVICGFTVHKSKMVTEEKTHTTGKQTLLISIILRRTDCGRQG